MARELTNDTDQAHRLIQGAIHGLLSAVLAASVATVLRFSLGVPSFFDLSENWLTRLMPTTLFAFLLDRLQFNAKPLLYLGLIIFQIGVGALLGAVITAAMGQSWPRTRRTQYQFAGVLAAIFFLFGEIVVTPIFGFGFFGLAAPTGPVSVALGILAPSLVYSAAVVLSLSPLTSLRQRGVLVKARRRFLGTAAAGAAAVAVADAAYQLAAIGNLTPSLTGSLDKPSGPLLVTVPYPIAKPSARWSIPDLSPEITPTAKFYLVSKNLGNDPHVDAAKWSLRIDGLVDRPVHLTYSDMLALPSVEFYQTLECISNTVGGPLISTAWWRGVRLVDILKLAGPHPNTVKVVFHAVDGYADSIPLATALRPTNVLAYQMNREPLRYEHGFPLRLLVPGLYGLKNVKWVTHIELVDVDFQGYWQQRGWTDQARIHTMSRIDVPVDHSTLASGHVVVAGIAFAGDRGIKRVQVSLDEGKSWQDTLLKSPLSPFTWRLWRYEHDVSAGPGSVFVKATDGTGKVQWPIPQDTVPDGATGQDVTVFTVR